MLSTRSFDYTLNRGSLLALGIYAVLLINGSLGQDIYFPGENVTAVLERINIDSKSSIPKTSTTEATISTSAQPDIKCSENMHLEKEINSTERFCECVAGYLYYRKHDNCYKQYTRGPCSERKHFILRTNETEARCVRNPCRAENTVMFKGACYGLLLQGEPCGPDETLVVPDSKNEPTCERVDPVSYQVITAPIKRCSPGSRRAGRGKCREIL